MELDMHVNRALLPFKAVYFFFLAGYACLLPFIPVYMHQLGLTIAETGLIRSLEPCVSFIASPILGSLADKRSKHKLLLIVSILGSSLLMFSLIFIPPTDTSEADDAIFHNQDNVYENDTVHQELQPSWNLNLNCSMPTLAESSFCDDSDQPDFTESGVCAEFCDATVLMSTREFPTHFGLDIYLSCSFCIPSEMEMARSSGNPNATVQSTNVTSTHWQPTGERFLRVYCLQANTSSDGRKSSKCSQGITDSNADPLCAPFIQNFPRNFNECLEWQQCICSNLTSPQSPTSHVGDWYVFGLVIVLILSSKIFLCNMFPLLDSSLMLTLGNRPQDYGKQRLWGAVGWGSFALISGAAIDALSKDSTRIDYNIAFYLFISLEAICFTISFFLVSPPHKSNKKMLKSMCGLLMQANIVTFLFVVTVVGMSFGIVQTYLFLFLEEIHSPHMLMGLTLTVSCVSEVPFLFFSGRIIKRITYIGVAYLTLLGYALRFLGYSLISNPWLVLPFELLHGFTYGAFWAACTSFSSANAPSGMTSTLQAVISAFHIGVGKGVGTALGGVVYQEWGSQTLFRVCLYTCLGTAVIYFFLRKFLVDGVEGPLALYRKFSLVRGEPSSTDAARKDSCLSELDSETFKAMDSQHMQLTMTTIDQSKPDNPPFTKTYHTHRPVLHNMQIPNTPDSPDDDDSTSPGSSSLCKLLRMEDRLPAAGSEVLELRSEGRPPVDGEESDERSHEDGKGGKQTTV